MNFIFLVSQKETPLVVGSIQSILVVAKTVHEARHSHPGKGWDSFLNFPIWAKSPDQVRVSKLGIADPTLPSGIILKVYSTDWLDDGK